MRTGKKRDISKSVFIVSVVLLLGILVFGAGLYSGAKRNGIFDFVQNTWRDVKLVFSEIENLKSDGDPIHFLQPSRQPGSGVTRNLRTDDGNLILLSSYFDGGNEIRLMRRDGTVLARWPLSYSAHFPDASHMRGAPTTDRNIDVHGMLIDPDGSVVFTYEYGGMVKLSRCGDVLWTLRHQTHHSIEPAQRGGYWVPGRQQIRAADHQNFPPFTRKSAEIDFDDDQILRVSDDGRIIEQVSVARLLKDNGLESILTASGHSYWPDRVFDYELVHLNKIAELSDAYADAFAQFEAGDLMLSLRQLNLVLVVDPNTWRVKWYQTGPWLRQHDPDFNADGTITVFNNNTYRYQLGGGDRSKLSSPRVSNIMRINPVTRETEVVYGNRVGQEFLTVIRGKHSMTTQGGVIVTEFEAGRVFETDAQGEIVWEYINRYDDQQVLEITEARLYRNSDFTVADWSCPVPSVAK